MKKAEKLNFKSLVAVILLSASLEQINIEQVPSSYDLGIEPISQYRDTMMLDLDGSPLFGEDVWDVAHKSKCSCDLCGAYCGYASIAMINRYYNGNLPQDRIAYFRNTSPEMMGPYLRHPEEDLWHHGLGTGAEATKTLSWALNSADIYYYEGKPSLFQIKQWIYQGRSILTLVPGAPLHFVVTKGYDGSYLHINDPGLGSENRILYDELNIIKVWVPPLDANGRVGEPTIWQDSDLDGVVDFDEINRFFTDPYSNDTDGDLVPDKSEIRSYTFLSDDSFDEEDVRVPDAENDGLRAELDPDSDNGGCPDGYEDLNRDGKVDPGETDPLNATDDPLIQDIAITDITPSKTVVGQGFSAPINVTIENHGDTMETFNITLYANATEIETEEISLTSGNSTTISIDWNTTLFPFGNYTISTNATLKEDVNIADNSFTDGWITVTIPGDVDGDYHVRSADLFLLAAAYASGMGDPLYDAKCDLDADGDVDSMDLFTLAANYGKRY